MSPPHDRPTASELVDAVREFLERDVAAALAGDATAASAELAAVRFHLRVAGNVLGIVARQLELGAAQAEAHAARLSALGLRDDAELAAAIRSGALDARYGDVKAAVWASVLDKLAVANPTYADAAAPADDQ